MSRKHFWLIFWTRFTFRYVTCRPLTGRLYTDRGFIRPGRKVLHPSGHATRWAHLPGWKVGIFRFGIPVTLVAETIGALTHPVATEILSATGLAGLGTWLGKVVADRCRSWQYNRNVRQPMIAALGMYSELPADLIAKNLVIAADHIDVPLAPHHNGQLSKIADISRIISQRIGGEYDAAINMKATPFYVRLTPVPEPPSYVSLSDVLQEIYATTQDKPILGLGTRGEVVKLDFTGEIAHLATSIGTGGGKSSFNRLLLAQFAYHGVRDFEVFDVKMVSIEGMENLPGLRIHREIGECWEAMANIRKEMDRRYAIRLKNPSKVFPRKIVVLEEQNAFYELSRLFWKEQGGKGTSPVYSDITLLLTMARQVNIIVIGVYQRMSAKVAGGGELRDQYGLKLMSRFSPQAWDSLVGTRPRGKSSSIPGRAVAIMGESQRTVQLPFVTAEEAMALALSGTPVTVTGTENQQVSDPVTPAVTLAKPRYSMAEAASKDWCTVKYATLRQRVSRAKKSGRVASDAVTFTEDEIRDLIGAKR
jgi:hypothetical protein